MGLKIHLYATTVQNWNLPQRRCNIGQMALSDEKEPLTGFCPACKKIGDLVHVGRVFYGVCHEHKLFWFLAEKPHLSLQGMNEDQQNKDGVSAMLKRSYFDTWLATANQINAGEFDMAPEEQRQ